MAKMFYSLEEAADKLGISTEQVKNLASEGKLQQFRDRDKLMFKVEQVDGIAANAASFADEEDDRSTGLLSVADGSDTDQIALESGEGDEPKADATQPIAAATASKKKDPRQETGVSVFDAGEVEQVDPMAQTQVTDSIDDEEELALQSIGSGSGLLDLTRESDETSLGAEVLDEVNLPGAGDEGKSSGVSSGVFDAAAEASSPSGLAEMAGSEAGSPVMPMAAGVGAAAMVLPETIDHAGSGLASGMLFGAMVALIMTLIVASSAVTGVPNQLTQSLAADEGKNLMIAAGGLALGSIIFGVVGFFLGRRKD